MHPSDKGRELLLIRGDEQEIINKPNNQLESKERSMKEQGLRKKEEEKKERKKERK